MKKRIISITFHATRIVVAMLLGIICYLAILLVFASLPITPWTGKTTLPFVVVFAITLACVVAVMALRLTKPPRSPSLWGDEAIGEESESSASPR